MKTGKYARSECRLWGVCSRKALAVLVLSLVAVPFIRLSAAHLPNHRYLPLRQPWQQGLNQPLLDICLRGLWYCETSILQSGLLQVALGALATWHAQEDDKLRKQTAQVWDEVFRTTGFGVISGHDVGRDVIEGLVQGRMSSCVGTVDVKRIANWCGSDLSHQLSSECGHMQGIRRFFARSHEYKMQYNNGPILSNKSGACVECCMYCLHVDLLADEGAVLEKYAYAVERVMHAVNRTTCTKDEVKGCMSPSSLAVLVLKPSRMSAVALDMDMLYFDQFYRSPASVLVVNYYPSPDSLRGKGYESLEKRRRRMTRHRWADKTDTCRASGGRKESAALYLGWVSRGAVLAVDVAPKDSGDHNDGSGGLEIDIADSW
eukprot:4430576-Amphidinium_carterae.1